MWPVASRLRPRQANGTTPTSETVPLHPSVLALPGWKRAYLRVHAAAMQLPRSPSQQQRTPSHLLHSSCRGSLHAREVAAKHSGGRCVQVAAPAPQHPQQRGGGRSRYCRWRGGQGARDVRGQVAGLVQHAAALQRVASHNGCLAGGGGRVRVKQDNPDHTVASAKSHSIADSQCIPSQGSAFSYVSVKIAFLLGRMTAHPVHVDTLLMMKTLV